MASVYIFENLLNVWLNRKQQVLISAFEFNPLLSHMSRRLWKTPLYSHGRASVKEANTTHESHSDLTGPQQEAQRPLGFLAHTLRTVVLTHPISSLFRWENRVPPGTV